MDFDIARETVMQVFYGLEASEQVSHVAQSLSNTDEVEIFPMRDFDSFCEKHFKDNLIDVTMLIRDSIELGMP